MTLATLDLRRLARSLFAAALIVEVSLVVFDVLLNYSPWVPYRDLRLIFNVANEGSLAGWFASVHMLAVAGCALAVAGSYRATRRAGGRSWLALAAVFAYLAVDDGAALHERVSGAVRDWVEQQGEAGMDQALPWLLARFPSYDWQVIFLPFFVLAGLLALAFLRRQMPRRRFALVLAGLTGFALAVGLDYLEGIAAYDRAAALLRTDLFTISHFQRVLEEYLEMMGMSLLMFAFLLQLADATGDLRLEFIGARGSMGVGVDET